MACGHPRACLRDIPLAGAIKEDEVHGCLICEIERIRHEAMDKEIASLKAERDHFKALADGEKARAESFELDVNALRSELADAVNCLAECRRQLSQTQAKEE